MWVEVSGAAGVLLLVVLVLVVVAGLEGKEGVEALAVAVVVPASESNDDLSFLVTLESKISQDCGALLTLPLVERGI